MIDAADFITSSSVLFSIGDRSIIQVTGRDRAAFLHNFCTNDVQSLQPGDGCEALVTDAKGHVLGWILLLARAEELLVWTAPDQAGTLISHWDRYCIREQVVFRDQSREWVSFAVQCGDADRVLVERAPRRLSHLSLADHGWLVRDLLHDSVTWLCLVPAAGAKSLLEQGTRAGATLGSPQEFDALRIFQGFPEYGRDVTIDNLPQEVDLHQQAIHFRKGCYLGQETVARIDALGHVNRQLVRLELANDQLPEPGAALHQGHPERPVGRVTSVGSIGQRATGLGFVRREFAAEGTVLQCGNTTARVLAPTPDL